MKVIYALIVILGVYLVATEPRTFVPPVHEDVPYVKVCRWDQINQQCYD